MHKLIVDPAHNLVRAELAGMLTLENVERYDSALATQFKSGKLRPGYRMLLDVSECAIQPQEPIKAFQQQVAAAPKSSRIAIVTGSSIIRMQVRRVMTQSYAKLFEDHALALNWLIQGAGTAAT